jgi:sulfur relay (sulfurtransferase) complex TusBCD TusD component (DsrE family)
MLMIRDLRHWWFAALLLVAAGWSVDATAQQDKQDIVVHISHYTDDLHAVSMGLSLATNLLGGANVTLFLDREGVRLADTRTPQNLRWGDSAPIAELYAAYLKAGGSVVLCAHCAHAAGLEASSVRQGARIGSDGEVRALILAADKIIDF